MVVLDATAGNRTMWKNRNPPLTVFMDKEIGLSIPPDVIAIWDKLPFRDNLFETILFDPPHYIHAPPWALNPKGITKGKLRGTFYGKFESKIDMFSKIHKAQIEFMRVGKRLCLKWFEIDVPLWKILPFFKEWKMIQQIEIKKKKNKSNRTLWITFLRN